DVVGLQTTQAAVEGFGDVLRVVLGRAAADVAGVVGLALASDDLGGEDEVGAAGGVLFEPGADVGLGATLRLGARRHGIHLGDVDQVDAVRDRIIELLVGFGFGVLLAPGHGAESEEADLG